MAYNMAAAGLSMPKGKDVALLLVAGEEHYVSVARKLLEFLG